MARDYNIYTSHVEEEREKLQKGVSLHWAHWFVVALSMVLTLTAWQFTKHQNEEKVHSQFMREANQVVELLVERMQKYEDGLWGGVGAIQAQDASYSVDRWAKFSQTLSLGLKYPGINGIGVIYYVTPEKLDEYLVAVRRELPGFSIHPSHNEKDYLPITYIEPLSANRSAVGLDIAHEKNRYDAALKSRDSGKAQVTGPIVLVQDAKKTPGFLFYAPFYRGKYETLAERRENFVGMVYAPFVVHKLLGGVLARQKRHVAVRIVDEDTTLYDEHNGDSEPLFTSQTSVALYGRTWDFDITSTAEFRDIARSSQPMAILIGGILVDSLLFLLFLLLSKANRRALGYADLVSQELNEKSKSLEESSRELEYFAYVSARDLQEPLRLVSNYTELLQARMNEMLDEKSIEYIDFVTTGAQSMQALVDDLQAYARVGYQRRTLHEVDSKKSFDAAIETLKSKIEKSCVEVSHGELPPVWGDAEQLEMIFRNLIDNAIKFRGQVNPWVHVSASQVEGGMWRFTVEDNGIGFPDEVQGRVFEIFKRFHPGGDYPGTGVGLAIAKKIVQRHGGEIWAESILGEGSKFHFVLWEAQSRRFVVS